MAGRLIGNGSANSSTVASPSANRRTIERRVGSDKAAKTTSNRSGVVTVMVAVAPVDTSQSSYLTEWLYKVNQPDRAAHHLDRTRSWCCRQSQGASSGAPMAGSTGPSVRSVPRQGAQHG